MTVLETLLVGILLHVIGIAIGKVWGSKGAQTVAACAVSQAACKGLILEKLLSLDQRLERIESRMEADRGKTPAT